MGVFYKAHPLNLLPLDKLDQIFPWLIASEMPPGLAGLVIAGVFAAAMSSLDSSIHSIVTAATTNFYERLGSPKTARQTLRMAKLLTLVLGVFGTGSAMVLATLDIQFLWDLFLSIVELFLGTLAGQFTLGIFSSKATAVHACEPPHFSVQVVMKDWVGKQVVTQRGRRCTAYYMAESRWPLTAAFGCWLVRSFPARPRSIKPSRCADWPRLNENRLYPGKIPSPAIKPSRI